MRDGERVDAVFDDGSGDRLRIDLIRLAGLALAAPRSAHPVRRDPHDAAISRLPCSRPVPSSTAAKQPDLLKEP